MSGLVAAPTSRKKIRNLTNDIRRIFGIENEKYVPIVHILELGLSLEPDFNLEVIAEKEMKELGLTYPEKRTIHLREDVYLGAIAGQAFHRFTVAHEIGHYFMHNPGRIGLAREESAGAVPTYMQPEWQANTFAGEFLAPPHIIRGLSAKEIMLSCGVSSQVANIQMKEALKLEGVK